MSMIKIRQHTSEQTFTLGDLEDLVAKLREKLDRDCVLWFPMDSRIYSDSHGVVDAVTVECDPAERDIDGLQSAFIDVDFS